MEDFKWLRERVNDEEILLLFTAVGDDLRRAVGYVMERASRRSSVENTLIELLEQAVDEGVDDTEGSVWIALILGELQSRRAVPVLLRALACEDETLAEAAVDAIQRIGEPAFDAVMEALEETQSLEFELACYRALQGAGAWEHPYLLQEVKDFLLDRLSRRELHPTAYENLALTLARLGERRALDPIRTVLSEKFHNVNSALQDAVEMLEENEAGVPYGVTIPSWEERLEWITGESFRLKPPQQQEDSPGAGPKRRRPRRPFTA